VQQAARLARGIAASRLPARLVGQPGALYGAGDPCVRMQHGNLRMPLLNRGLHERLITAALETELAKVDARLEVERNPLRAAEAADRIALHVGSLVRRFVLDLGDDERVALSVELARRLVAQLGPEAALEAPAEPAEVLHAIANRLPDGTPEHIAGPQIPLLDTTLLTNAPGEPRVASQVHTEIRSADRIDLVMAFIRRSGIAPFLEALRGHASRGAPLRILTTVYTGSTEAAALDLLREAGAEVRVSYDTSGTRLHAKAWLFHRGSGFSTAYIGSSNLTYSAQVTGLEWNVRVSGARNPDVIEKVAAVFESYWNGGDFVPYEREAFLARTRSSEGSGQSILLSPVELHLYPFQERMLEQVALARERGNHRNLLVSATGTGKTVMAAVDYARLRDVLPRARLMFVAHREEILNQALATFRHALRDGAFGELWVGGQRPRAFEQVFASIQSLNAAGLSDLAPDHFDVVIIDEFHHAAAPSYGALLERVRPRELLGLTATPERSDGLDLLHFFDGRIAAELRLWDAIDQHRLVPFVYYGIHDQLDLRDVPWRRGRGYDVEGLSRVYTANDVWGRRVLEAIRRHIDDPLRMRALGFCVSVEHARFMARIFGEAGVRSVAVWGDSPDGERRAALADLAARRVNVVFAVDIFNEGVDVPAVDTLLLLRPTDSPTLFLQQLGRGLRKADGKTVCTVLDFVGLHRREFRFDRRFGALLGGSRRELEEQVESGFPFLPAGCHMELDHVARDIVLRSIREAVPTRWPEKVEELRRLTTGGRVPSLAGFLEESGLDLDDVYTGTRSWSDLLAAAGVPLRAPGPHEAELRRAVGRLRHVDDVARIDTWGSLLARDAPPDLAALPTRERRLVQMLVASLGHRYDAWAHPQVRAEACELLDVLRKRVDHVQHALPADLDVPLVVHARYTRIEILAGFGVGEGARTPPWQSGVYWVEPARADLLAFTLDKTSGKFSPTTRYRDYAISRELIHWESQSVTRADSETGQRYRQHAARGTKVMLFARRRADDRAFWFLGPATYVRHEGERPMAVTWRLEHPLPGDLFVAFAAAVA
jgi:superfamily II DNA or RNA helicase/HKD family nuclease